MIAANKQASPLASCMIPTVSFLILTAGIYVLNALTLASSILGDPFFAVASTLIELVVAFPVLVLIGFLFRLIAEGLSRRKFPRRRVVPWLFPIVFGIGCSAIPFVLFPSPRAIFRHFLGTDPPRSMSHFQYWWTTVPGDTPYVFRFNVDPSEFKAILSRHVFAEDSDPEHIRHALESERPDRPGTRISLPRTPLTTMYRFSETKAPGVPVIIDVFTTKGRDEVLIYGDN